MVARSLTIHESPASSSSSSAYSSFFFFLNESGIRVLINPSDLIFKFGCKKDMACVLKSTNIRFNFVLHFILWVVNLWCIFDLSGATTISFSHSKQRSSLPDGFKPDHVSDSWHEKTLLLGSSHKILEAQMFEATTSWKRPELQGGANEIRTGMALKLIHRTSLLSQHSRTQSARIGILKELLELDAARLKGYRFRSWISGNSENGQLSSTNATSQNHKAAEVDHVKHSLESAKDKIRSGAAVGLGLYFVDFYVGTPARKYTLIADTGSDLIWVQCSLCRKCYPQSNPIYVPEKSSSFSSVPCYADQCFLVPAPPQTSCSSRFPTSCKYTYIYNDGTSTTGFLASDSVTMTSDSGKSSKISNITFGCGIANRGQSLRGSNGVLGLGMGPLSFASQLGNRYGGKFSYCLVDYLKGTADSSLLVFGDAKIEQSLKINAIQYTPLLKNRFAESFYYVGIKEVRVDGRGLSIPSKTWQIDSRGYGGTIVDSGTTLTYFTKTAYSLIVTAFQTVITAHRVASVNNLDVCFNSSAGSGEKIPKFSILLEGDVLFQPPQENYFVDTALDVKCLAMQVVDSPLGSNTIGNLLQQNFYVEYDRSHARLGFVPANCSSSS